MFTSLGNPKKFSTLITVITDPQKRKPPGSADKEGENPLFTAQVE